MNVEFEDRLYRLSVNAGLAIAIKNLALENSFLDPHVKDGLLLKDGGMAILAIIKAYYPEEYEFQLNKLMREREAMELDYQKKIKERIEKAFGSFINGSE